MKSLTVAVAFLSLALCAGEFDKSQLVSLLEFPQEHFEAGFSFTQEGLELLGNDDTEPKPSPGEQLARAELRRAMEPDNPDHLREVAYLLSSIGNTNAAAQLYQQAESRYRSLLKDTIRPPSSMVNGFAEVLRAIGKIDEAEKLLCEQVKNSPNSEAWNALGDHHTFAAFKRLTGEHAHMASAAELQQAVQKRSDEERATINKQFNEALASYDRAIELSTNKSGYVRKRMTVQVNADLVRDFSNKEITLNANESAMQSMFARYVPGLRQVAKLEPHNPEAIAAWMFAELMAGSINGDIPALMSDKGDAKLSEETRSVLNKGIGELKKLSKNGYPEDRRVALVSLGFFQSVLGEKSAGQRSVKRAIKLDRSKSLGWDTLSGLYVIDEPPRWKDLLALCRDRSKYNDSARNHFIAAKAAEKLDKPLEAMSELQAGLKLEPNHANSALAMCVLLLREGSRTSIEKAHATISELVRRKDLAYDQWRELMIAGGVCFGLADQHDTARQWFTSLLEHEPDDERGKSAMAAWKN